MGTQILQSSSRWTSRIRRRLLPGLAASLPLVLLAGALWMLLEVGKQRDIYLRSQAGLVAASLETIPEEGASEPFLEHLLDETPGLRSVRFVTPEDSGPDAEVVRAIAEGRQLFHATEIRERDALIFRYYTPFHMGGRLRIARIDLDARAADFLMKPAWTNVVLAVVVGLVLLGLLLYALRVERMASQLEHLAHLGKMSAVLAHEIRNPLGTIKGFTQLALEHAEEATRGYLGTVLEEIHRLERLVQDLLLYGRPLEPRVELVRWNELARGLEAFARDAVGAKPVRFQAEARELELTTDPNLLKQVLLNLIRNAIEAMDGEGVVRLDAQAISGQVRITVEDEGPGLTEDVRKRVFEPFFTTKAFGTGLGLSICRKVAQTLGGAFEIHNRKPRGASALLTLPKEWKHGTDTHR